MVDWDELKRLDALRNEDMEGVGLDRAIEIIDAKSAFPKLLDASFPDILAEREAEQRLREAVALCLNTGSPAMLREALSDFDKETQK